jgi:hypothetical protein
MSVSVEALVQQFDHVVGLVRHGLFIGTTSAVHVAGAGTSEFSSVALLFLSKDLARLQRHPRRLDDTTRRAVEGAAAPGSAKASTEPKHWSLDTFYPTFVRPGYEALAAAKPRCAIPSFRIR